jgi:hypothetical protein
MLCLMCGQDNSEELNTCPNCNAPMPKKNSGISSAPPKKVYDRYNKIRTLAEQAKSGEISMEEFREFLLKTKSILETKEKDIKEIEIQQEYYNDFLLELEVGFHGLQLFYQGIDILLTYINIKSDELLERGLQFVNDGNEFVNEAMSINREHRRQMEELYSGSNLL